MGLNHIYKVIWSKTKQAWVVVSELAKRDSKSSVKSIINANGMRSAVACMVVMALGCGTAMGATTFYGQGAATIGLNATSIGSNAQGLSEQSIAIGHDSLARDQYTIAIGGSAVLNGAIGIGIGANANNIESIALGRHAGAFANQSIAVGKSATTRADKAIAIGLSSGGNATSSIAIGEMATTLVGSNNSIAMGSSAQTKAEAAIAVGKGTLASHEYSVALGNSAQATQLGAISMGHGAQAGHSHTIAIGTGAKATQLTGIAMGQNVVVDKPGSIGIGTNTTMDNTGVNSISIGRGNTVNAGNVVALGNYITVNADVAGAVVLGNGSSPTNRANLSDVTISNTTFKASNYAGNASGATKGDIVSVGKSGSERQIKHVGAGVISATSTDAVNGSQLYYVANDILATPLKFAGDSGDTLTPVLGNTVNIKGSIASGVTTTDGNIAIVGDNTTKTLAVKMAKELSGLTSANFTDAAGNSTVVNGGGVTITPIGGGNAISVTTGGINAGGKEIKGVATGTTNDAAVNKGQLDAAISGATSTETVVAATAPTGDTNLATVTGQTGTAKGETYEVFVSENAVKTVAQTAATNVVNNVANTVNALSANTITLGADSNSTTAQALNKTGGLQFNIKGDSGANALISTSAAGDTVTVSPTAKLTNAVAAAENAADKDLSNITPAGETVIKNLATTTVNNNITKAVADADHDFGGDTDTKVTRKHGQQLDIKGGVTNTADLTSGNIGVVTDSANGVLNIRLAKVLNGLTSASFTDAAGNNTVVNGGGVTITPIGGGNAISVTTGGINAGSKEIKGVATGTTNDAAVNKGQLDAAISGVTAGAASTETVVAATAPTGDTNLATVTGQTGTAKGETYEVFVSENAVKTVAQTAATNVVNNVANTVNALSTNTITLGADSTSTTAQALNKTGGLQFNIKGDSGANALISTSAAGDTVTVSPTAKLTNAVAAAENAADKDLSNITPAGETVIKNLATTTVNNNITKAVADADHDFGGDTGTKVTRKHGQQLDIKGGVTNTADLTTGNIGVVTDSANGALNIRLAKVLNGLTSASFTDAAGNSTVVNGGGVTITPIGGGNAISVTTGGINAGGKEIKGVATGTTNDAAVNKGQLDAAITTALSNISGGAVSTESVVAAAPTAGDTNLVTVTTQTGTKIGETYAVSVSGNAVKALATQAANQVINTTNLNIAGDSTTGSVNLGTGVLKVAGSNGVETVANGSTITVGLDVATRNKIDNAATNAANGANKDLSNISPAGQQVIKDTAAWHMKVNGNAAETIKGGDTVTFNNGNNIEITQVGKDITVATKQDVTFNTITGVSTITGAGAGAPSISFNNPSGGTPSISVNAPIDMNGKTITNLADGVNPTDAVNKQQLDTAIMSVGGNPGLNDRVNKLSGRVDKVGAGAAALAALHPLDFDPDDKWNFAAGYGNYAGQNAMALGAFYRPNEDTLFSVSGTMGTGEDMVNAGVSFKLGQSSGVTNSRVAMAQEIKNLKNAVDIVMQQNQTLMKQNQVLAHTVSELSGKPIVSDGNFNDVPANHWAYGYVKALAQQGIIVGYEDGAFKGDRTMTRYELAAVIYRALQSGANIDADMKRAMDEFGPELEALRLADTFRIDRVSGDDNDRHKIDRVRVNNQTGRDVYGNHVQRK